MARSCLGTRGKRHSLCVTRVQFGAHARSNHSGDRLVGRCGLSELWRVHAPLALELRNLRERMLELAGVNSKQPEVPFEVDAERKARIVAAVPGIAREAARLEPLHQALRSWSVAP